MPLGHGRWCTSPRNQQAGGHRILESVVLKDDAALNPKPETLNSEPETLNQQKKRKMSMEFNTLLQKEDTSFSQLVSIPWTLNPQPSTLNPGLSAINPEPPAPPVITSPEIIDPKP